MLWPRMYRLAWIVGLVLGVAFFPILMRGYNKAAFAAVFFAFCCFHLLELALSRMEASRDEVLAVLSCEEERTAEVIRQSVSLDSGGRRRIGYYALRHMLERFEGEGLIVAHEADIEKAEKHVAGFTSEWRFRLVSGEPAKSSNPKQGVA